MELVLILMISCVPPNNGDASSSRGWTPRPKASVTEISMPLESGVGNTFRLTQGLSFRKAGVLYSTASHDPLPRSASPLV